MNDSLPSGAARRSAAPDEVAAALAEARSWRVPDAATPDAAAPAPAWAWAPATLRVPERPGVLPLARALRLSLAAAEGSGGRLRPVPSAGALHPVNAHLLIGPNCPLPPGRYAYDPRSGRVLSRGPAPADAPPGAVVVLTVTARRTVSHYGHRAWPLLLLDAGHAAAALALAGASRICLDADARLLSAAAGLPPTAEWPHRRPGMECEHPLAAVHFVPDGVEGVAGTEGPDSTQRDVLARWARQGLGAAPLAAGMRVTSGGVSGAGARTGTRAGVRTARRAGATAGPGPYGGGAAQQCAADRELERAWRVLELVTKAPERRAGWRHGGGGDWPAGVLPARRSAPPPLLGEPSRGQLGRVLAAAQAGSPSGLRWCVAVGGVRPGLLERESTAGQAQPWRDCAGGGLGVLATGDARPTLAVWAAGQGWIAEAGAVLLAYGCPADAAPERVRRDHLGAGYAVGLAQATAAALGLAARPIGSWQRADLGAALGGSPGRDWIVHGLALGRGSTKAPPVPPTTRERGDQP